MHILKNCKQMEDTHICFQEILFWLLALNAKVMGNEEPPNVTTTLTPASDVKAKLAHPVPGYSFETLPRCGNGTTYKKIDSDFHCYAITEPSSFPPACPYPDTTENEFLLSNYVTNQTVWAPTTINTLNFETPECFVFNQDAIIAANCKDNYSAICIYDSNSIFDAYCRRRYNDSCVASRFSKNPVCYCKSVSNVEKTPRQAFCKKLAEPIEPFQNHVLKELISSDEENCWMGLYMDEYSQPRWSSTHNYSNYTLWSSKENLTKPFGGFGQDGWMLQEDATLNCAICEVKNEEHPKAKLVIEYNKTTNALQLEVINATEILQEIVCFQPTSLHNKYFNLRLRKENYLVINVTFPFDEPGYYYCTASQIPNLDKIYSNKVFFDLMNITNYVHEYMVSIQFTKDNYSHTDVCSNLKDDLDYTSYIIKPIKIINSTRRENTSEIICHIKTPHNELSMSEEYKMIENLLMQTNYKILSLTSPDVCLPAITISKKGKVLNWPETAAGAIATPNELCVEEDGTPITRTCIGNSETGAAWSPVSGTCSDVTFSPRTVLLNSLLLSKDHPPERLNRDLLTITQQTENVSILEINLVSKVLSRLESYADQIQVPDVATTINNIMHIDHQRLKSSQKQLNSTNKILHSLDNILTRTKVGDTGFVSAVTEKLAVQIADISRTEMGGVKVGDTSNGFHSSQIERLQEEISQDDLVKQNFDLAIITPQNLQNDIIKCVDSRSSPNVITTLFYDDTLFNEQTNSSSIYADSKIVGVIIPNFNCSFQTPLQIIFKRPSNKNAELKCASWVYGARKQNGSVQGRWFAEKTAKSVGDYEICEFTHVTHFTLLIVGDSIEISKQHKKALDVLTAISSGLSILGLLAVFLTAIVFKSYRSANGVVINFSAAMTLQIVILFVADNVGDNKLVCTIFGAILHYSVLAQFFWMLTIALLQYKRYVVVFSSPTEHLIVKACIFSWGVPLVPVVTIVSISTDNYGKNSNGLCYVLGNYFWFGVLAPVAVIVFFNLLVFLRILVSISSSKHIKAHRKRSDTSTLQLKLAIMLYFLLGLTWGFGLLAAIGGGVVYSYLFCITAALQGFVLFVYFVVLNDSTRLLWVNTVSCCHKCKTEKYDDSTSSEPAATAMIRRGANAHTSNTNTDSTTSEILRRYGDRNSADF